MKDQQVLDSAKDTPVYTDPMPIVEPEDSFPEYATPAYEDYLPDDDSIRQSIIDDLSKDFNTKRLLEKFDDEFTTEALINEREKTHGDFSDNSWVSQGLKDVIRSYEESNTHRLTRLHRDALDMIFAKVGRIVAGNPNFQDHWDDIAGYARLVSQRV